MKQLVGQAALAAILVVGVSCGDDDDIVAPDASAAIDAEVPPDAMPCNTMTQTATEVAQDQLAEPPPVATGGGFPDGAYHLIADVIYTRAGGATGPTGYASTLTSVCSAELCEVVFNDVNNPSNVWETWTVVPGETSIRLTRVCGPASALTAPYTTATDVDGTTTTTFHEFTFRGFRLRTYELQP